MHEPAVLVVRFGVARRMAIQLAPGFVVIAPGGEVVAVLHRRDGALEWQDLQPVPREIEIANDLGSEQRDDVGEHRELEAREDLFGDGGAADSRPALEHQHRLLGAREVGGRDEAVVPAADDDRVVALHARLRSGLKKGSGVTWAFACLRRCSTVTSMRTSVPGACSDPRCANAMYRFS